MPGSHDKQWMGPLPAAPACDCHICRPDESCGELDRRSIDTVLEYGWQVITVGASAECCCAEHDECAEQDAEGPAFSYTLGLGHRAGHPEVLMSGLDYRLMYDALNRVAQLVISGRRLAPGDVLEDILGGVPVVLEEVAESALSETVRWSEWFHRRKPAALAVVWPDTRGVFAWQPGAPADLDELQPPEWRVPFTHTGALAPDPTWDFPVPPDHGAASCTHVVDRGAAVLWAVRQSDDELGEAWTIHCGGESHTFEEMRLVHIAHLVRSAPGLRQISGLGLDEEALRQDANSSWRTGPLST